MKDAMEFAMNHPPGVTNSEPIKITFFKKEACDKRNEQGFRCTFTVMVTVISHARVIMFQFLAISARRRFRSDGNIGSKDG